jgi:hypothetical protein
LSKISGPFTTFGSRAFSTYNGMKCAEEEQTFWINTN